MERKDTGKPSKHDAYFMILMFTLFTIRKTSNPSSVK
jgi:hypothetical protein